MKKLFIILLLSTPTFGNGQSKPANGLLEKKIDSLISSVKNLENKKSDSSIIKIDKLDEVFKKSSPGWLEKYMASIIALITVAASSGVAYYIGSKNANTQLKNTAAQLDTQIAIAADQMKISRDQIEQNTKNTLAQIRSNNISKARIEWIESLRPILSELFVDTFAAWHNLKLLLEAKNKNNQPDVIKFYTLYESLAFKIQSRKNQVELFLNPLNDSHKALILSIDDYINAFLDPNNIKPDKEMYELSAIVIDDSRIVLKEAWEKAKSESTI